MNCALDASVLVAAARPQEEHSPASVTFLEQTTERGVWFFCPVIVLPECAAAIARATGSGHYAARTVGEIYRLPRLRLIDVDRRLADRAAQIAMAHRIRGADSLYASVAEAFDAELVTWDAEMLERAPAVVPTMTPADWLAEHAARA